MGKNEHLMYDSVVIKFGKYFTSKKNTAFEFHTNI